MNKVFALLLSALFLTSCNITNEDVHMNPINGTWDKKATQKFQFEINDAQNPKNIIFVVRNNNDYPYNNLRVFSSLYGLNEKKEKVDTLNYILAKPNGEWIGSGFGDTKEILFQYKINHRFPKNGMYIVEVQHAMRRDQLKGIEDIGVLIEPAKP